MATAIVLVIIVALVTLAIIKIVKEKRKGHKCIGCPCAGSCHKKNCH